jgi:hypothetical protein
MVVGVQGSTKVSACDALPNQHVTRDFDLLAGADMCPKAPLMFVMCSQEFYRVELSP